jgi:hypothetical protein
MDRVVEFHEKLAMLMHISGGQPARGLELLSVRHSNTVQGGHCNVFIENGMVVFVTRYHKGYNLSQGAKWTVSTDHFFVSAEGYACRRVYLRMGGTVH